MIRLARILAVLLLSTPAWALTGCPTGLIEIADTLVNSIGGGSFSGSLTAIMTYNSTNAGLTLRGQQQPVPVTNGTIDICLAPGFFKQLPVLLLQATQYKLTASRIKTHPLCLLL